MRIFTIPSKALHALRACIIASLLTTCTINLAFSDNYSLAVDILGTSSIVENNALDFGDFHSIGKKKKDFTILPNGNVRYNKKLVYLGGAIAGNYSIVGVDRRDANVTIKSNKKKGLHIKKFHAKWGGRSVKQGKAHKGVTIKKNRHIGENSVLLVGGTVHIPENLAQGRYYIPYTIDITYD